MLNDIDSNDEEDINNLMNDTDTEFEDQAAIENLERDTSKTVIHKQNGSFIPTTKPIESVVRIAKPSSDIPLMMF